MHQCQYHVIESALLLWTNSYTLLVAQLDQSITTPLNSKQFLVSVTFEYRLESTFSAQLRPRRRSLDTHSTHAFQKARCRCGSCEPASVCNWRIRWKGSVSVSRMLSPGKQRMEFGGTTECRPEWIRYEFQSFPVRVFRSLSSTFHRSGVAALNQYIFVVGGFDGTRQLASVERYDTENNVWTMVAPIKVPRSALSLTVLDEKLYAMGGFDGHNFVSIVEVYDSKLNKWEDGTPLTSGRSGHASAVIYQPSCASTSVNGTDMPFTNSQDPSPSSPDEHMQDGSSLSENSMDVESSASSGSTSQTYGRQNSCVFQRFYGFLSSLNASNLPDTPINTISNVSNIQSELYLVNIFKFLWTTDLSNFAIVKFGHNVLMKFLCKVKKKNQLTTSALLSGPVNTLFINDIQPS